MKIAKFQPPTASHHQLGSSEIKSPPPGLSVSEDLWLLLTRADLHAKSVGGLTARRVSAALSLSVPPSSTVHPLTNVVSDCTGVDRYA